MSIDVIAVGEAEVKLLEGIGEGQFSETKATEVSPSKMAKGLSAFANTDGGDVYVGIDELLIGGGVKKCQWRGFKDVEAANRHLQAFERLFPLGAGFQYEFLRSDKRSGLVLHIEVSRTPGIVKTRTEFSSVRKSL